MAASSEEPGTDRGENGDEARRLPPRRKPPVTIDLAANPASDAAGDSAPARDDDAAATAGPTETGAPMPPPSLDGGGERRSAAWSLDGVSLVPLAAAALAGAILAIVVGIFLQAAGIAPSPASRDARTALAQTSRLEGDMNALAASMRAAISEQQALSARLAGLETIARDLITTTEQLRSLDGLTAATEARLRQLEESLAGLQAALKDNIVPSGGDDRVAALSSEVDRLSARLAELADKPPVDRNTSAAARGMTFAGLRAAAERGESFREELALLRLLGVDAVTLAELDRVKDGAPSKAALAARFEAVAEAVVAASDTDPADATVIARIWRQARSLVTIRPVGPIAGTTPEAIVSRMRAAVTAGDIAAALAERAALPEPGRTVSAAWARDAETRLALDRAVANLERAIETAAATQ
jgi:hypothetical protein